MMPNVHPSIASLAEENCLAATFDIASTFDELQLAHKKEVYVTIVTAQVRINLPVSFNISQLIIRAVDADDNESIRCS